MRTDTAHNVLVQMVRLAALTKQNWSHKADTLAEAGSVQGQSEDSPGNRNAAVSSGEHAVLLLGVDHGLGNCHRGGGVDNGAGSVGESEDQQETTMKQENKRMFLVQIHKWC